MQYLLMCGAWLKNDTKYRIVQIKNSGDTYRGSYTHEFANNRIWNCCVCNGHCIITPMCHLCHSGNWISLQAILRFVSFILTAKLLYACSIGTLYAKYSQNIHMLLFRTRASDFIQIMMTSSNGNIFRVTGLLCGEFTGDRWIPRTKANDAELGCFL